MSGGPEYCAKMKEKNKTSNTGSAGEKFNKGQFKKGNDSRRNKNGQVSKERLKFNKELRQLLVEEGEKIHIGTIGENTLKLKKVEWLVKSVWGKAIAGEAWAVNFIAERVEGKIAQPLDMAGDINVRVERIITDKRPKE